MLNTRMIIGGPTTIAAPGTGALAFTAPSARSDFERIDFGTTIMAMTPALLRCP